MSAAVVVLPQVWAMAAAGSGTAKALEPRGPRRLQLVRACAEHEPQLVPAASKPVPAGDQLASAAGCQLSSAADRAGYPFYRKYTEGLLRRYQKMSLEAGRVPALLGREMFRGNVTNYKVHSFEDVVIFVHDVDRCIRSLEPGQQHLVRRIGVQAYTQGEAAAMLGIPLRTIIRRYNEALDDLTRMFLQRKMLVPLTACEDRG